MSEALSDAWAKWTRGRERFQALYRTSARAIPDDEAPLSVRLKTHLDVEESVLVVTVDEAPVLSSEAAMSVSEAVFHFRTALDCAVRELAWMDSDGDPRIADQRQSFPIVSNPREWSAPRVGAALEGVTEDHVTMIKRLQPYRPWSGSSGEIHPLRVLHALAEDDRHQLLRLTYSYAASAVNVNALRCTDCRVDRRHLRGNRVHLAAKLVARAVEPGAEVARVPLVITGPKPSVEFDASGQVYVSVGSGLSVVQNLGSITEFVRQVLQIFEFEFARPRAPRRWRPRQGAIDALPRPSDIDPTRVVRGIAPYSLRLLGRHELCQGRAENEGLKRATESEQLRGIDARLEAGMKMMVR